MTIASIQPVPPEIHLPLASDVSGLQFLWLEITEKCNLSCKHCYADSGPQRQLYGAMTRSDWLRVIEEGAELDCRQLQFIGGEPTLHPHLPSLIGRAHSSGYTVIEVFTNATRLTEGLIDCMRTNSVQVASSFYSDDPAVHETITNAHGSWRGTVRGFEAIVRAGLPLRVGIIEMSENAGHAHRAAKFLESLGITDIGVDHMRGVGRGDLTETPMSVEKFDQLCGQCWKAKLCVTSSGSAFPCVFARQTNLGNVKQGLATILSTAQLQAFRRHVRELEGQRTTAQNESADSCWPDGPCQPQLCRPDLQCSPQGPHCEPDRCSPGLRCTPDL